MKTQPNPVKLVPFCAVVRRMTDVPNRPGVAVLAVVQGPDIKQVHANTRSGEFSVEGVKANLDTILAWFRAMQDQGFTVKVFGEKDAQQKFFLVKADFKAEKE